MGVASDGLPVVIELKKGASSEPPANLLVQAAAYGLALCKAWPTFRSEWTAKTNPVGPLPSELATCHLACAAPAEYWESWRLDSKQRAALEGFALALAAVGVFGVVSQSVSERMREFGVRIALGATPRALLLMVLTHTGTRCGCR